MCVTHDLHHSSSTHLLVHNQHFLQQKQTTENKTKQNKHTNKQKIIFLPQVQTMSHHRYPYHQLPADLLDQLPVLPRDYGPDHSKAGAHVSTYADYVNDCSALDRTIGCSTARRAAIHKGLSGVQPMGGNGLIVLEHAAAAIKSMSGNRAA